ncbi:uncharacterized protein [Diadema antillarum]|uniref:uncharacterized protein n=1 Tax=Diadema antillarum TaxID=105358 RepID=UPI003A89EB74
MQQFSVITSNVTASDGSLQEPFRLPYVLIKMGANYYLLLALSSCHAYSYLGLKKSGLYVIDPDGASGVLKPFLAQCDFSHNGGGGYTIVHHNKEARGEVKMMEDAGTFQVSVAYNHLSMDQMRGIIEMAESCEQRFEYQCYSSVLNKGDEPIGLWISHDGSHMYNWGRADGARGCPCADNKECGSPNLLCKCDSNKPMWQSDEGMLTDRNALPVTKLGFGDVSGDSGTEMANYTLGPLNCTGDRSKWFRDFINHIKIPQANPSVATSCEAAYEENGQFDEYQLIDPDVKGPLEPFRAECYLRESDQKLITEVKSKNGFIDASVSDGGPFSATISYGNATASSYGSASIAQLRAMIANFYNCSQTVEFLCRRTTPTNGGHVNAFLQSPDGKEQAAGDICEDATTTKSDVHVVTLSDRASLPLSGVTLSTVTGVDTKVVVGPVQCYNDKTVKVIPAVILRSCYELKREGYLRENTTDRYLIDPNPDDAAPAEWVDCNGDGTTIIGHDRMGTNTVPAGADVSMELAYDASMKLMLDLIQVSQTCHLQLTASCFNMPFFNGQEAVAYWTPFNDTEMYRWFVGNEAEGRQGCPCSIRDAGCDTKGNLCNCDNADGHEAIDQLTLPVPAVKFFFKNVVGTGNKLEIRGFECKGSRSGGGELPSIPVVPTCEDLVPYNLPSGYYIIDPDGLSSGLDPFVVFCNFTYENGVADVDTIVTHETNGRVPVDSGGDNIGGYYEEILYKHDASIVQLRGLVALSEECEQGIAFHCKGAAMWKGDQQVTWWNNRRGERMPNWGDVPSDQEGCACHYSQEGCEVNGTLCNCDANKETALIDMGLLSDKAHLPVWTVRVGDVSAVEEEGKERGFYELSPLVCRGKIGATVTGFEGETYQTEGIFDELLYPLPPLPFGMDWLEFTVEATENATLALASEPGVVDPEYTIVFGANGNEDTVIYTEGRERERFRSPRILNSDGPTRFRMGFRNGMLQLTKPTASGDEVIGAVDFASPESLDDIYVGFGTTAPSVRGRWTFPFLSATDSFACENEALDLTCPNNGYINVVYASFGQHFDGRCSGTITEETEDCHSDMSYDKVVELCQEKQSCTLTASPDIFGNPCPGTPRYLHVKYMCSDTRVQKRTPTGPCLTKDCKNGGRCVHSGDSAVCVCPKGWTGDSCQTEDDMTTCLYWDGVHVVTFDGKHYVMPGSETCEKVVVQHQPSLGGEILKVLSKDGEVMIQQGSKDPITLDQATFSRSDLPDGIQRRYPGNELIVELDFGGTVELTRAGLLRVELKKGLAVSGLCGNMDGNVANDQPSADQDSVFPMGCSTFTSSTTSSCATADSATMEQAEQTCQFLLKDSPKYRDVFQECESKVDPASYYQLCKSSVCYQGEDRHCWWIEMYARECQEQLVNLPSWKEQTECCVVSQPSSNLGHHPPPASSQECDKEYGFDVFERPELDSDGVTVLFVSDVLKCHGTTAKVNFRAETAEPFDVRFYRPVKSTQLLLVGSETITPTSPGRAEVHLLGQATPIPYRRGDILAISSERSAISFTHGGPTSGDVVVVKNVDNPEIASVRPGTLAHVYEPVKKREYSLSALLSCSCDGEPQGPPIACNDPLGMESGSIPDGALTASSSLPEHGAQEGRLDSNAALTFDATGGAWVAQVSDRDQWIEVQLPRPTTIVGVQTQGRGGDQNEEWVSSFDVRYRREGPVLQYVNNADGIAQTFEGNSDKNTIKTNYFAQPVEAELIRIQPKTWNRRIALRFELLGCRDSNPCASNPCQNGGSCIHDEIRNTYVCRCPEAYSGQNCDEAIGTCVVYPASTIRTYDLRYYRFPGECEYVLSQTCAGDAQQNFSVSVTTIPSSKNSSHVPERREVKLTLGGKTYELRGDKELYVDGEKIRIPYITHDIQIILAGNRKPVMKTPFGLRVWWDGESSVRVEVPDHFQGKLCGLCGNFNGEGEDDLMERGGSLTASATEFGLSWAVSSDCKRCPLCDNEPVCNDASHAASQCAVLNDENGPFSGCLQATEREMLYIYCVTDVCAAPGDEILCETLDALDQECRSRSAAVSDVRDLFSSCVGTPLPGTTFEPCLLPCTPTCVAPRAEDNCDILTCVPGLACSPGLVFNGETCVRHDQCGCLDDGRQYEVGETFTKRGCNLLCTCQEDGKESCQQITCHEDAMCDVHEGVYGCHCKDSFSGDGQECVAINNPVDTLECQDATVNLSCENGTIDILSVFYGQDGASSACQPTSPLAGETCSTEAAALSVQALCQGRRTCTFVAGVATFGEPCAGIAKYVRTEHHCSETVLAHSVPDQAVARGVEEGSTLNLRCPNGTVLIIEAVRYGRSSEDCFEATAEVIVREACHGKVACQLPVTSEVFGRPCEESPSRLKVASKCTSQPVDPDIEVHPCNTQPCNNGRCIATNDEAGFRCCCHEGFTGQFCDRVEGHCQVFGGSQVITFDNDHYRFYGDCYYTLFKDCTEGAGKLPVEVRVKGQKFQGLMRISFVTEVQVLLGDRKVSLTHGKGYIVDGFLTELPFTVAHDNITLSVRRAGNTLVASTNRGISVQWDGKRHVVVSVAKGAYKPCGMCGNFDDNPDNDAQDQNGQQNQDPCVRRASYNQQAFEICSVLTDKNGPFSACHATVDPEPFFNACMQDQCSILPATDLVCADLEAYADTCLGQGIKLPNWRVATGCGFSCPPDMIYTSCSDGFVRHCGLDELETTCSNRCYEGCECRLGKVLSGRGQCVNPHECGCTMSHDQDRFYASPGMSITQYGCQKYCECSAGNILECQDYRCSDQGTCGAGKDLRYGCHCMSGYSGNGHYCQKEVIEYPRMHAVVTEGQVMKLDCGDYMLDILDVGYGSLELVCEGEDEVCDALSSRAMVLEMCQGYQKCAIPACDRLFGDPCFTRRHYLSVYYTCRRHPAVKHPRLPYRKVICQDHPVMLNCRGGYINVLTASYGRSAGREICAHDNIADQSCHEPTSRAVVMKLCQGHEKCEIWANARTFPDPCPNTYKYLEVQYECLDSKLLYYTGA